MRLFADVRPLKYAPFRRLWLANIVTVIGAQMTVVAIPAQIFHITGSSGYVGLAGAFGLVPLVVFGLWGGSPSDVIDRRPPLAASPLGPTVTGAVLALIGVVGEHGAGDDEPEGGGDEQLAPIDDICQRAAPEAEDHEWNEAEGSGESDVSRGPGDVEDLGRDRNDRHLSTDDGDDIGQPETPEGSVLQRANISEEPHRSQAQADFLFVLFRDLGTSVGATLESTTSLVTTT